MQRYQIIFILLMAVAIQSCEEFLDSKPNKSLVVPTTLDDFQQLLDAELRGLNNFYINGLISSDDVYFNESLLNIQGFSQTAHYFWESETFLPDEWDAGFANSYTKVLYANIVLEGLESYEAKNQTEEQRKLVLESSAKFFRALGHYEVLMHFAEPFDPQKSEQLGVPIRLTSDVNVKVGRSTMRAGFAQIIEDLKFGLAYLPEKADIPTRPSKWASLAFLGRVYLSMHDFQKAYDYSKLALDLDNTLMDFKGLTLGLPYSFKIFNNEVIFYQKHLSTRHTTNGGAYVNPDLIKMYDILDLRPGFFFRTSPVPGLFNFRGNYTGDFYHFGGLAVDEVMLNLAEGAAKTGREQEAILALNYLLKHRYKNGFSPIQNLSGLDLMKRVILERRKELVYRGIRWLDLKRHNLYPELASTLERKFNQKQASLPPNDPRYAFLIPPAEMNLNPIEQNKR